MTLSNMIRGIFFGDWGKTQPSESGVLDRFKRLLFSLEYPKTIGPFTIQSTGGYGCYGGSYDLSISGVKVAEVLSYAGYESIELTSPGKAVRSELISEMQKILQYQEQKDAETIAVEMEAVKQELGTKTLFEATRDLHHACEAHPVGQRMSAGTVTPQEWADWLAAFRAVHVVIDPIHPDHLRRVALLDADLALLPAPRPGLAATALADSLTTPNAINAAAYVLHGAHRRGGRVLASTMGKAGLPTGHVFYPLPDHAEAFVKGLRDRTELADAARAVFDGLLAVMDEIDGQV